jgi:phosphomannomutase
MLIESVSGVRGVVGTGLNARSTVDYAIALGEFIGSGKIVIGRDSRPSGETISSLIARTLQWKGIEIIDLGIVPTPTVQLMVEKLQAKAGIAITASHNPFPWNGLKFIDATGRFFNGAQVTELLQKKAIRNPVFQPSGAFARYEHYPKAIADHIENVLSIPWLEKEAIRKRKYKVVVDAVNGGASEAVPGLLEALGCQLIKLHCVPNGIFPHTPEPLPENLTELMTAVRENKADLGMAIDPDGDRLAIVSEEGKYLSEEYTLVMASHAALNALKVENPVVVTNLSTTRAMDDIVNHFKGTLVRTAIGEINVSETMFRQKAVIGGEGNGGVILPDSHLGRDALVGAALILQFLVEKDEPISKRYENLPQYRISKLKIDLGNTNPDQIILQMSRKYAGEKINTIDGLKIEWNDRWVHLRKSNTEPILRIYSEAPGDDEARSLGLRFKNEIEALIGANS